MGQWASSTKKDCTSRKLFRQGAILLHLAAEDGKEVDADSIVKSNPLLIYDRNADEDTALHVAARSGKLNMVKFLMDVTKWPEVVEALAEDCTSKERNLLRMQNLEGNTPLHEAVMAGHKETVKFLIKADSSLASVKNKSGDSPLFLAVDGNFFDIAVYILDNCWGCSYEGRKCMTVLHAAAIRIRDESNWRRLRMTCSLSTNSDDIVNKFLEKYGTETLDQVDEIGWMPHHYAAHLGNVEVLKRLLELNESLANCKVKDDEGMSALHIAARNDQIDVITTLINMDIEITKILDNRNRTALHVAVESGKTRVVKFLLNKMTRRDINRKDKKEDTCLHLAASHGHVAILIMLANNEKVDKKVFNKLGMNAIDLCESNREFSPLTTVVTTAILRRKGTIPSLDTVVNRGTKKANKKTSQVSKENMPAKDDMAKERDEKMKEKSFNESGFVNATDVCESNMQLGPHATDMPANANDNTGTKVKASSNTEIEAELQPVKKGVIFSQEGINNMININLVVATIIAGVAFSAIIAMPGGYNDEGVAILGEKTSFKWFLLFDSLAFSSSAALMFIHFLVPLYSKFVLDRTKAYPLSWVIWLTIGSTLSMVWAFVMCTIAVLEGKGLPFYVVGCAGIVTSVVFALLALLSVVRRVW